MTNYRRTIQISTSLLYFTTPSVDCNYGTKIINYKNNIRVTLTKREDTSISAKTS